ncbi:unnamed protein product [Alopecurus aequalis]
MAGSCPIGPVPFKDVAGEDDHITPPEEYGDIISTLPSINYLGRSVHYQYQGGWVLHQRIPGVLSFQERFTPRSGDVLLASAPKCGTTWLKALSFATMARAAYPPDAAEHPLLRLNPHECVPFLDDLFSAGHHDKLEALPSPRLMNTHMHHAQLPSSVANNIDCKIIYICREPKDMLVSLWHFAKTISPNITFTDVFDSACQCEGESPDGPIWSHILGYWCASKISPERVMFLRLETMKGLDANNIGMSGIFVKFPHKSYFRKGSVGDWVNHMTPEMAHRFDAIVDDKIRGSGLSFRS